MATEEQKNKSKVEAKGVNATDGAVEATTEHLAEGVKNISEEVSNDDISSVQKLPLVMKSTKIIWQSLLPEETGEATVTVRLEDENGNLLSGRVLTVQNRSDLFTRLRISIGALFLIGAGIAILSPVLPFFASLIGL